MGELSLDIPWTVNLLYSNMLPLQTVCNGKKTVKRISGNRQFRIQLMRFH